MSDEKNLPVEVKAKVTEQIHIDDTKLEKQLSNEKIKIKGSMDTSDITQSLQQVSKKSDTIGGKVTGLFKNIGSRFVSAGIDLAIDAAWNGIISAVDNFIHRVERTREKAAQMKKSFQEINSTFEKHKSTVSNLADKYEQLRKGVDISNNKIENKSLSPEKYKEFLDINKQLHEDFPSLAVFYDQNSNPILNVETKDTSTKQKLNEVIKEEEKQKNYKTSTGIKTAFDGVMTYINEANEATLESDSQEHVLNDFIENGVHLRKDHYLLFKGNLTEKEKTDYAYAMQSAAQDFINSLDSNRRTYLAGNELDAFGLLPMNTDTANSNFEFYANLLKLTPEEIEKLEKLINKNIQNLDAPLIDKLSEQSQETEDIIATAKNEWYDFLPNFINSMKSKGTFQKLDTNLQEQAIQIVQGLDYHVATEMDKYNSQDPYAYIRDKLIVPMSELSNDKKKELNKKFQDLFALDKNNLSQFNQNAIKQLINDISKILNKDPVEIRSILNFDVSETSNALSEAKKELKIKKYDERGFLKKDDDEKIFDKFWEENIKDSNDIDIWNEAKRGETNLDDIIKKFHKIKSNVKTFDNAWDSIGTSGNVSTDNEANAAKEKLLKLAETGKLTVKKFENSFIADDLMKDTHLNAEEITQKINELVSSPEPLAAMKTGISSITSVLSKKKQNLSSKETYYDGIAADTLAGLPDDVKQHTQEYEHFVNVLGDGSSKMSDCEEAANNLATAYMNSHNFLSKLTPETVDYYTSLLKQMGIENASEIVTNMLAEKTYALRLEKLINAGASQKEISALQDEAKQYGINNSVLTNYVLKKKISNNNALDTSKSIRGLISLAKQCGTTSDVIVALQNLLKSQKKLENLYKKDLEEFSADGAVDLQHAPDAAANEKSEQIGKASKKVSADRKKLLKLIKKAAKISLFPKDDGKGDENKYKNTKQQFDWIERRVNRLTSSINLLNAKKENLFSVKKKNSNLNKQIKETTKLINTYSSAIKKYDKKADSVKIFKDKKKDKNIKKLIRNGKIQIKDYDEGTAKKIQDYQNWYDKSKSAEQSRAEAKKQKREKEIEKFTGLQEEQDKEAALANVKQQTAKLSNKNKAINDEANATKKSYNYQIKIAEAQGDKLLISKLKEEKKQKELEFQQQRVDNIKALYDARRNILDTGSVNNNSSRKTYGGQYYKNQVELAETRGLVVDASWYQQQNRIEQSKIAESEQERAQLISKLSAFEEGTQEWYNLQADIAECDKDIVESRKAINENSSSIHSLKDSIDNKIDENLKSYASELDFVSGLKYENELDSDTGSFTDTGNLHILSEDLKITVGREAAKNFSQSLKTIEQLYSGNASREQWELAGFSGYFNDDGSINKKAVEEKIKNLRNSVQSFINMQIEGEKRLIELGKQKYEAQKNYLNDIINAKKNALSIEKDLYDYERSIAEKTQAVANIQKQIHSLQGDDSEEGRARLAKLQVSLDTAQKDLQDTEYSRYISDQQSMLDNLMTEYEDLITNLMNDTDKILLDMYDYIKNNEGGLGDLFIQSAEKYGYVTSQDLIDIVNAFKGINDNKIEEVIYDKIKAEQISQSANDDDRAAKEARAEKEARAAAEAATKKAEAAKRNNVDIISRATDKALRGELTDRVNLYQKTKNKISSNLKGIFQAASFASGGIVDYKPSGEDGLVWARNGEGFVQPEDIPPIKELIRTAPKLNEFTNPLLHLSKTPDITPNRPMNTTSIENVQFTFDLPNVQDSRTLLSEIQSNSKIQRAILEVGLGQEHGNGKLAVRRIR